MFLNFVLAAEKKLWFQPECTGMAAEEGGLVGPSPRAFHVAVAIDCNMFIFGGRYGRKRFDPYPCCFVIQPLGAVYGVICLKCNFCSRSLQGTIRLCPLYLVYACLNDAVFASGNVSLVL